MFEAYYTNSGEFIGMASRQSLCSLGAPHPPHMFTTDVPLSKDVPIPIRPVCPGAPTIPLVGADGSPRPLFHEATAPKWGLIEWLVHWGKRATS